MEQGEARIIDAQISPEGKLDILSRAEVKKLMDTGHGGLYDMLRSCALAVLNCGNAVDDGKELLERYQSFDISIIQRERGFKLDLKGAPARAFVDGKMIKGIHEHLFAVLRDVVYVSDTITGNSRFDLATSEGITDAVFHILRNANILHAMPNPNVVVCWGGHSIPREEYEYTKEVGHQLGLRGIPSAAEDIMVDRDIVLAAMTGSAVHIAHLSTSGALRSVREGKARGIDEVEAIGRSYFAFAHELPHYFDACARFEARASGAGVQPNEAACMAAGHRAHETIVASLGRGVADGSIRPDGADPFVTALALWAFMLGVIQITTTKPGLLQHEGTSVQQFVDYVMGMARRTLQP